MSDVVKIPGGFDAMFRQVTPLVLLGVLVAVIAEPWLPGTAWLRAQFGDQVVLRTCCAVLVCYVLILWGETMRLHSLLMGVLGAFRQFERGDGGKGEAARNPKARLEAARLLIAALGTGDPSIRATSRHNLTRLVGQDLGDDPAAWQAWLQRQETGPS